MSYPIYTKPPDDPPKELRNKNPIGECIYCGCAKDLETEHVVPRGMRGTMTLPKACCHTHARLINRTIETPCMSDTLIHARVRHRLHRTPRGGFDVTFWDWKGNETTKKVPIDDFPLVWSMAIFEYPGVLENTRKEETRFGMVSCRNDEVNFQKLLALPNVASVRAYTGGIETWKFARWIAKIGYCYAVACLGLQKVRGSPLVPLILEGEMHFNYLVGGLNDLHLPAQEFSLEPPTEEIFRIELREVESVAGKIYWAVYVRLMAMLQSPSYLVVVAEKT